MSRTQTIRKHCRTTLFSIMLLSNFLLSNAQSLGPQLLSPFGFAGTNGNLSVAVSMGEVMTETYKQTSGILTQGFHQGKMIMSTSVSWIDDQSLRIFPNPFDEVLNIQSDGVIEKIVFYDLLGNTFYQWNNQNRDLQFNLKPTLNPGVYVMQLFYEKNQSRIMKIVKY